MEFKVTSEIAKLDKFDEELAIKEIQRILLKASDKLSKEKEKK